MRSRPVLGAFLLALFACACERTQQTSGVDAPTRPPSIAAQEPEPGPVHGRAPVPARTRELTEAPEGLECEGCNLILVVVDTLRADHLPCYGHERDTAPNLCALAAEGVRFTRMLSNAPSTKPAIASLFTAMLPSQHGTVGNRHALRGDVPTLAETLRARGYDTVAVNANPVIKEKYGYDRGFRRWVDQIRQTADVVNEAVVEELDGLKSPFFLYVHYLDPHDPYLAPDPFYRHFNPDYDGPVDGNVPRDLPALQRTVPTEIVEQLRLHYDAEIRYVDDRFGRLMDALRQRSLYDGAAITVLSDHGEMFQEHGLFLHSNGVHAEVIEVPWVLKAPGLPAGSTVGTIAQTIDVMPTVLQVLGVEPLGPVYGESLFELFGRPERQVMLEHLRADYGAVGLVAGRHKLIRHSSPEDPAFELYDVVDDPDEATDLGELPEIPPSPVPWQMNAALDQAAERAERWAVEHLGGVRGEEVELDEESLRELEALGYLQ